MTSFLLWAVLLSLPAPTVSAIAPRAPTLPPWSAVGHRFASRAAVQGLPEAMPAFFRQAGPQLEYLGPEPDRWRSRELRELDDAFEFDHYIDLETVPAGALEASDRYEFLAALYRAGIERPQQFVGFLPWRILEMYQRLASDLARWRSLPEGPERRFAEARVIDDAGILGHYVADASQPHHTTIHFNGWAEGADNPQGYTVSRDFHSRFESGFVGAHVTYDEVVERMGPAPRELGEVRQAVWDYVEASNHQVERLYQLEKAYGFQPGAPPHPETVAFAAARLTEGAEMLRALWWRAWQESEGLAERSRDGEEAS